MKGVKETPKIIQAIAAALGCFPKCEGKLKTPHTQDTRLEDTDTDLKSPPWGLALIAAEDAIQDVKKEKQLKFLFSCKAYQPQQWLTWQGGNSETYLWDNWQLFDWI